MIKEETAKRLSEAVDDFIFADLDLGVALGKLKESYGFDEIVAFLKGEKENCLDFYKLKPLYDKYSYKKVNQAILHLVKNGEIETRPATEKAEEVR